MGGIRRLARVYRPFLLRLLLTLARRHVTSRSSGSLFALDSRDSVITMFAWCRKLHRAADGSYTARPALARSRRTRIPDVPLHVERSRFV